MVLTDSWATSIALDDEQYTVVVTIRQDVESFRESGKLPYRIEIILPYEGDALGMPYDKDAESIGDIEEALRPTMEKDKLAILTGNYLGGNKKYWIFYTRNVDVFFDRLNDSLEELPTFPLSFEVEEDPTWEEYSLMKEIASSLEED